ncbi:MAG: rhodanese-like domain-containing protein [Anaerolineae bacterium]|nr:rhodanese-like domain-containing protein [Anaerolineae bacterium]MDW8298435.1 rhodanese-like domain-containing protein [Anaerolineae bacterium]
MSFLFGRKQQEAYGNLSVQEYRQRFYEPEADHVLVDVRTTGEFFSGHIPNALNIPLDQLSRRLNEIPQGKPVVVVCASGNRSRAGADILVRGGYTEVYNLRGGTLAWMMSGGKVE